MINRLFGIGLLFYMVTDGKFKSKVAKKLHSRMQAQFDDRPELEKHFGFQDHPELEAAIDNAVGDQRLLQIDRAKKLFG